MIKNSECWLKEKCNHCDCEGFCMRLFKLDYLYNSAYITTHQRKHVEFSLDSKGENLQVFTTLSTLDKNILEFVNNGDSLYIHSYMCGNGKTSWALRLVQSYFNRIWSTTELRCRALFISVPKLLSELKNNISSPSEYIQHIKENIYNVDIVIWDDVATKTATTFEAEQLFEMIDGRINNGKSNIFTSNLSEEEIHKCMGDRLASRICNVKYNLEIKGKDWRGI